MYTDGIVEAFNDEKKPYGIERLEKIIRNSGSTSADDLLETILDDLEQFVQHTLGHRTTGG
jgi:serine phosphatase RsbU (regulator of sigma subunit)